MLSIVRDQIRKGKASVIRNVIDHTLQTAVLSHMLCHHGKHALVSLQETSGIISECISVARQISVIRYFLSFIYRISLRILMDQLCML